jgi:hypothetical protein
MVVVQTAGMWHSGLNVRKRGISRFNILGCIGEEHLKRALFVGGISGFQTCPVA